MSGGTRVPKRVCWVQIGETIESEEEEDAFGTVVNFDKTGSRFIVSAPLSSDDSGRMTLTGMVKVYEAMPTGVKSSVGIEGIEFVQVGQTLYGEYSGNRIVGFLSANGESLVVAAPSRNENNGSVFVYSRENGEEWELVGEPIDGKVAGERFGHSVTISNDATSSSSPPSWGTGSVASTCSINILYVGAAMGRDARGAYPLSSSYSLPPPISL